jgi:hypothetical protein
VVRGLRFCFWPQLDLIWCAQVCLALMREVTIATTSTATRAEQSMQPNHAPPTTCCVVTRLQGTVLFVWR